MLVTAPGRFVTGLWTDSGQSEVYSFTDDTGQDLLEHGGGDSAVGAATDHKAAMFEIHGRRPPTDTAVRVSARGRVLVSTAAGVQAHRSASVAAKKGDRVKVAGFEFRVGSAETAGHDGPGMEIELSRSVKAHQLREICRIRFEDAAGNPLAVEALSSASQGIGGELEMSDWFLFRDQVSEFVIVVDLWAGRVETSAEYEASATIGCGR